MGRKASRLARLASLGAPGVSGGARQPLLLPFQPDRRFLHPRLHIEDQQRRHGAQDEKPPPANPWNVQPRQSKAVKKSANAPAARIEPSA